MFSGCTSLVTAPELPATTLTFFCYYSMFSGCTSLVTAPELPATTLADRCYSYMFYECTSLTTAPSILPATELANYCYYDMFYGCTSLVTAPELPATTLEYWCYHSMFYGCTSLTTAPELKATTLAYGCYSYMFSGCTSLTTAPELPATTLADSCYFNMFNGCTSLTTAPELPATTLASECYSSMFQGCTSLVTAPELTTTILGPYCYSDMFRGCTSLVDAPELPAINLIDGCYYGMFRGCTSLVTAPELLATELAEDCYSNMFCDCSKLNKITMLANKNVKSSYLYKWVEGVSSTGTFVRYSPAVSLTIGVSGIPNGWTVEDYYTITSYKDLSITANNVAWNHTQTTINWSVTCDAISHDNHTIEIVLTGKTESDSFEQNTSDTDIIREISFTYMGITATTTIVQYAYKEVTDGSDEYLTFTNTGEDVLLISIFDLNNGDVYAHSFSIDNGEWVEGNLAEEVYAIISPNQSVRFKSNFEPFSIESGEEPPLKTFVMASLEENNPSCSVSGNIMSLLYGDDFIGKTDLTGYDVAFYLLFAGNALMGVDSTITDASELILPATTLAVSCYEDMFAGCTSLITAPELPATKLDMGCYSYMFAGCTGLTTAPALPATTLAENCYNYMFNDCTSLTTAPALPATTLANYCYSSMFYGCTGLTTAPALPATTLSDHCYYGMFRSCSSLTIAPELPATTLASSCYQSMFLYCSKLNYIKMLAIDISADYCLNSWVSGVASTGTFVKHSDMTSLPTGVSGIPSGWTVVDNVEKNLITFTIGGVDEYQAEEGMTWEEWVNSEYNTDDYYCESYYVRIANGTNPTVFDDINGDYCSPTDVIITNHTYILYNGGGSND